MAELHAGTITFLFTDIEGSTQLLKGLGERYDEVLAGQQRILRAAVAKHDGREVDTQGESSFVAFRRAKDAVGAAVDAQRGLAAHTWPNGVEVKVRMGLHTGEPRVGEERYLGFGVHRAARICAAGHGGQVLLSNAARELVEDELPAEILLRELGSYRLKDVDRPERLFQLEIEGLQNEFPPLKAPKIADRPRLRRRALLLSALAGVIAAAVAIPIFALGQGSGGGSLGSVAGNSVGLIDSKSNRLVGEVAVGTTPTDVAVGAGAVWVTNAADGTVDRIDPVTRTVRQTIRVGNGPDGIAFGDGSIWVANGLDGTVSRIDPGSNEVIAKISVGNGPTGIAVGRGSVWVVNRDDSTLSRIDPATGTSAKPLKVGVGPIDVAVGAGGLWVTSEAEGTVLRVEPDTGKAVDSVPVGRGPGPVATSPGAVWVANSLDGTVSRIDPATSTVTATVTVGGGPAGIAAGPGAVWVASEEDGSVSRIEPRTNRVVKLISLGSRPAGITADPAGVFVATRSSGGEHRGGTLTMLEATEDYGSVDPALAFFPLPNFTNDGLTAFKRVGGRESTDVVPDLATSLPQPADAGRTYTFRLRKGIRYSTGEPVRPADFRRALERVFELNSFSGSLYASIVGATTCLRRPKGCDLSRGIVADPGARTVTFHLSAPDPDLPAKLALPPAVAVPERTPSRDVGRHPLPATGPYVIASIVPGRQIRFVRNPRFREWSSAARPAGYPDEIVIRLGVPSARGVPIIARGEADVVDLSASGAHEIAALRTRYGSRLHSIPGPYVGYVFLNTHLAPFDDVRVRRALNYAVDRQAVVQAFGGPSRASPSCQVLPSNYPGYRRYCPYLRNLAKARRLVAASGTGGTPVVVWARSSYKLFFSQLVDALRGLGYPARLKFVDDSQYYTALEKAGPGKVQAGYIGWGADVPRPAGFIRSLLDYLKRTTGFRDATIDREIERALQLQQTDAFAANELWARIDRMIVDRAPLVPLYNARAAVFVSARVGNYQYHPMWFTLLDQLWVR